MFHLLIYCPYRTNEKNSGVFILDRIWKNGFTAPKNAQDANLPAPVISILVYNIKDHKNDYDLKTYW